MADPLYSDRILSHYYHPLNYGLIAGFEIEQRSVNPLCGDSLTMRLCFSGEIITDICFKHDGCVVSRAAASLLFESTKGKSRSQVRELTLDHVQELLGIDILPGRLKCATLGLEALKRVV